MYDPISESRQRDNYIDWEDYFMGIAVLSAQRSKAPAKQFGACIVDERNRLVGVGYNSMPYDFPHKIKTWEENDPDPSNNNIIEKKEPWGKSDSEKLNNKEFYENAIWNQNSRNLGNCSIYTTLFPCNKCAQIIIQSNIKNVIYLEDKSYKEECDAKEKINKTYDASEEMLRKAHVFLMHKKSCGKNNKKFNMFIKVAKEKAANRSRLSSDSQQNCMRWDEYFMAAAVLAAEMSKDPNTQVGACIVDKDNNILGIGYNGIPKGIPDDAKHWREDEDLYVVSAVQNAILHRNSSNVKGCRVYTTLFPDHKSAHAIIQSKIKEVIYMRHNNQDCIEKKANKIMKVNNNENIPNYDKSLDTFVASRVMLENPDIKLKVFHPSENPDFRLLFPINCSDESVDVTVINEQ